MRVQVRKGADADRVLWLPSMDHLDGRIVTLEVSQRPGVWRARRSCWCFHESWLTPVEVAVDRDIDYASAPWTPKVGEWVEVLPSHVPTQRAYVGEIGKVCTLKPEGYMYRFDVEILLGGKTSKPRGFYAKGLKPHTPTCANCRHSPDGKYCSAMAGTTCYGDMRGWSKYEPKEGKKS
jgi:hypothetical protein